MASYEEWHSSNKEDPVKQLLNSLWKARELGIHVLASLCYCLFSEVLVYVLFVCTYNMYYLCVDKHVCVYIIIICIICVPLFLYTCIAAA